MWEILHTLLPGRISKITLSLLGKVYMGACSSRKWFGLVCWVWQGNGFVGMLCSDTC